MAIDSAMDIELLHFPFSPYNEKVRWALDLKRVAHKRTPLLPGPHLGKMKKLTGQTATPALRIGPRVIAGSAAILAELDTIAPAPRLLPADPAEARRALEIEKYFDEILGPRIRRAVLDAIIARPFYTASVFGQGQSTAMRIFYGLVFPLARPLVAKANGITGPQAVADGVKATEEGLAFAAGQSAATGYLIGGRFSLADLAVASMLAPAVDPPGSPMERPGPRPVSLEAWLARWRGHRGRQWVLDIYAKHRPNHA